MRIILASESPFRKHALDVLGLAYETIPSNLDEKSIRDPDPVSLARKLSEAKARAVGTVHSDALIIAADLFVVKDGCIYEKPRDPQEASQMLERLSGNTFSVISGLAVYRHGADMMRSSVSTCDVTFRSLAAHEINDYIQRYPVLKCSAAHEGDGLLRFAERITGSYNFRAGMSVHELVLLLREHGIMV